MDTPTRSLPDAELHATAGMHCKVTDYEAFRQGCLQFINNATGGSSSGMQLGAVSSAAVDIPPDGAHAESAQYWTCGNGADGWLNALGPKCYNCGEFGHYAMTCPKKGKGGVKGKGKSDGKGKDSSKGSFGKGGGTSFQKGTKGFGKT